VALEGYDRDGNILNYLTKNKLIFGKEKHKGQPGDVIFVPGLVLDSCLEKILVPMHGDK
jgi:hypothetical protein